MDFEIKNIEMIERSETNNTNYSDMINDGPMATGPSLILNELYKENEELTNKLKLNYRRLLLFETENNRLLEEKNKLFFEAKNLTEKNTILAEKNNALEAQNQKQISDQKLLSEKINALDSVNKTQSLEINRYNKFHKKIQDVVKPFIVQLKQQILSLKTELAQTQKNKEQMAINYKEFVKKVELELTQKNNDILSLQTEKNATVKTYEEQIHSFSKEILELQTTVENYQKEVARLKKGIEFKNYFENEVIRFKRTHEEDQAQIAHLSQKTSELQAKLMQYEDMSVELKNRSMQNENRVIDLENKLEGNRIHLAKKIDELDMAHQRLNRLEKLNNQLSLELNSQQS